MTDREPDLSFARAERLAGVEPFHHSGTATADNLLGFWRWSASDLLDNTLRGILAEYIVALDLGLTEGIWSGWDPFDLKTDDGIAVEVKSAAYIQRWHQRTYSRIVFGIARTRYWDPESGVESGPRRWADVYVFSVLANRDPETVDPLDLDQWEFYILPTAVLNERVGEQKTIGLNSLLKLGARKTGFGEIGTIIRLVLNETAT